MPRRRTNRAVERSWLEQARQIADFGDRWLVSIGRSVNLLGDWPQDGAGPQPGSAPGLRSPRRNSPSSERKPKSKSARGRSGRPSTDRPSLDLVSATPANPPASPSPPALALEGNSPENPPGVLPLVQALGRVVADHQDCAYSTLAGDERLWTLVDLLQVLARRPERTHVGCDGAECSKEPCPRE
jgi:hypothetical protein